MTFRAIVSRFANTVGVLLCVAAPAARAQTAPEVTLTRIDCGVEPQWWDLSRFTDSYSHPDAKVLITYNCYLIKHGNDYLIYDTGRIERNLKATVIIGHDSRHLDKLPKFPAAAK